MIGATKQGIAYLLVLGCCHSLGVQAAGDGTIVIQRDVQPRVATRPTMRPDPHPITANTNPSSQVNAAVNAELTDGDIAGVSSGNSITRAIMPGGNLSGLSATSATALPGAAAGHSGGAGGGIANTVNSALSQGLAPLQMMSGGK